MSDGTAAVEEEDAGVTDVEARYAGGVGLWECGGGGEDGTGAEMERSDEEEDGRGRVGDIDEMAGDADV